MALQWRKVSHCRGASATQRGGKSITSNVPNQDIFRIAAYRQHTTTQLHSRQLQYNTLEAVISIPRKPSSPGCD